MNEWMELKGRLNNKLILINNERCFKKLCIISIVSKLTSH